MKFPPGLSRLGYTEEELERDNPHNQWLYGDPDTLRLTSIERALHDLNQRIEAGHEFPDELPLVCFIFNVDPVELTQAYDDQFSKGAPSC